MRVSISILLVLSACGDVAVGSLQSRECRPPPDRVLYARQSAECPGDGTSRRPFCRVTSAINLIKADGCVAPSPWVLNADGEFIDPVSLNAQDSGDREQFRPIDLTVVGGTFGGLPGLGTLGQTVFRVGERVHLTLKNVSIRNADYGVRCEGFRQFAGQLSIDSVSVTNVLDGGVQADGDCRLEVRDLQLTSVFNTALSVGGPYDVRDVKITASANRWGALLNFDNGAVGAVDGVFMQDNLTRWVAINCSQLPRTLKRLYIKHRAPIFPQTNYCRLEDSTVEIVP